MTVETSPCDVRTTLNYCVPHGPIPLIKYITTPPPGIPWMNFDIVGYETTVHDARNTPLENESSLDIHAFQFLHYPANEKNFDNEASFAEGYYKEVQNLVLDQVQGAKKVVIFDHTLRRLSEEPKGDRGTERGPLLRVHVDQTEDSALKRVYKHLPPSEAQRLLALPNQRIRIINIWRPIANPVAHTPLALADWRTINPPQDLVVTRKILHPGEGEGGTYNVRYSAQHGWYYLRDMRPEECVMVKCSDTRDGVAKMCLHTAFVDATCSVEAPKRQSIEVRCLVFDKV